MIVHMMPTQYTCGLFPPMELKRKMLASHDGDAGGSQTASTSPAPSDVFSAFTPCAKRRRTDSTSTSKSDSSDATASSRSFAERFSLLSDLFSIVSNTVHECRIGVSRVSPWPLGFSVRCRALLQNYDCVTGSFALLFLCERSSTLTNSHEACRVNGPFEVVGGSVTSTCIRTGEKQFFVLFSLRKQSASTCGFTVRTCGSRDNTSYRACLKQS